MAERDSNRAGHEVFISYSRGKDDETVSDLPVVKKICSALKAVNIHYWFDDKIEGGDDWIKEIEKAIDQSKVVILVYSSNSGKSKWVKREIIYSDNKNKTIIPFILGDAHLEGELGIIGVCIQEIRAQKPPKKRELKKLVKAVRTHLQNKDLKAEESQVENNLEIVKIKVIDELRNLLKKRFAWAFTILIISLTALFTTSFFFKWPVKIESHSTNNQQKITEKIMITGTVKDNDGKPITNAQITINAYDFEERSDGNGNFIIPLTGASKGDKIELLVYHKEYESFRKARIIQNSRENFDITLKRR